MPKTSRARKVAPKRPAPGPTDRGVPVTGAGPVAEPVLRVAKELRRWTDAMVGLAGGAADLSMSVARATVRGPRQRAAIEKAGALLRHARQAAGLTTKELGKAIDLSDPTLLDQAERGKVALPFEVILRLAGILGRHDPLTFAMQLTRSYNAGLWRALEDLGVGRLVVQAGRERELANIYRGCDAARRLSDEEFAAVLRFVKAGFEMAVDFRLKRTGEMRASARARVARRPG